MKPHTSVAILILILGSLSLFAAKLVIDFLEDRQSIEFSDARATKGSIRIGMDNWVGYFPLCSPVMKRKLYQQGYKLDCIDDQADYSRRMEALAEHKLDLAVATVDSFVVNGARWNYPGKIVAVLDESNGGDALLSWQDKIGSIDELRLNQNYKIAFTPGSPSDHLLKAIAVHFDIQPLKNRQNWPVTTNGSEQALKKLLKKQVDAAVLWQPDVSRALKKEGIHLLLGTDRIRRLIVDVLIAGHQIIKDKPEALDTLLTEYFHTLKYYRDHEDELIDDLQEATELSKDDVKTLLKGVQWQSLSENADQWFGLSSASSVPELALIETIDAAIGILRDYGSISRSPLPDNDPYRIINSQFIADLQQRLGLNLGAGLAESQAFRPLTDTQWENMRPVGMLKIRPIIFASGSDLLTLDDKQQLDKAAETLKHYPDFRILVRGHTSIRGDKMMNKQLSQDRADAVVRYLKITHDIPAERMHAIGYGSDQPLPRKPGESRRSYHYRLPRVELLLVADRL